MTRSSRSIPHFRHLATRLDSLGTEGAYRVADEARALEQQGRDILHLEIGEPDFATAPHIVEAGINALRHGKTKYAPPRGIPELRDAVARSVARRGIAADPDNVVITSGAKPLLLYSLLALLNDGDEVLLPDPGFPIYASATRLAGGTPVSYPFVTDGDAVRLDIEALKAAITRRTTVLIINTPHNPTGWVASAAELDAIAEIAIAHDLWVLSDEIYEGITFHTDSVGSIAALPGMHHRTLFLDGFSKRYAMTGWRLGYAVLPAGLAAHFGKLIINTTSCVPAFVQLAGVAALDGPQGPVAALRDEFKRRRDLFVPELAQIPGVHISRPAGAFFAFADVRELLATLNSSSAEFARCLLTDYGVATLPGTDFGANGEGFIRFSFASSPLVLGRAAERVAHAALELLTSGPVRPKTLNLRILA